MLSGSPRFSHCWSTRHAGLAYICFSLTQSSLHQPCITSRLRGPPPLRGIPADCKVFSSRSLDCGTTCAMHAFTHVPYASTERVFPAPGLPSGTSTLGTGRIRGIDTNVNAASVFIIASGGSSQCKKTETMRGRWPEPRST